MSLYDRCLIWSKKFSNSTSWFSLIFRRHYFRRRIVKWRSASQWKLSFSGFCSKRTASPSCRNLSRLISLIILNQLDDKMPVFRSPQTYSFQALVNTPLMRLWESLDLLLLGCNLSMRNQNGGAKHLSDRVEQKVSHLKMGLWFIQNELFRKVRHSSNFRNSKLHSKIRFMLRNKLSIAQLRSFLHFLKIPEFE